MRKIFLFLACLFFTALIFSQPIFEGKVIHKLSTEKKSQSGTVEILYGKQKIRGKINMPQEEGVNQDEILIDFTKGILYHLYTEKQTYRLINLKNKLSSFPKLPAITQHQQKIILNHPCLGFLIKDTAKSEWLGEMDIMFWYADSLYFPVSQEYLTSDEIPLFTNGKTIGMGMVINMPLDGKDNNIFVLTPTLIEKGFIPDSLFQIPINYKLVTDNSAKPESLNDAKVDGPFKTKTELIDTKMTEIKHEPLPPKPPIAKRKIKKKQTSKKSDSK